VYNLFSNPSWINPILKIFYNHKIKNKLHLRSLKTTTIILIIPHQPAMSKRYASPESFKHPKTKEFDSVTIKTLLFIIENNTSVSSIISK
jgi:hypothetical protein